MDAMPLPILLLIMVVVFIVGFVAGALTSETQYRQQAIERGYAQYDSKTGNWAWKETK